MGSSPTRGSSFFLGKVTALRVLCCFALFVCSTLLASFFLPSFSSLIKTCIHKYIHATCTYNTCTGMLDIDACMLRDLTMGGRDYIQQLCIQYTHNIMYIIITIIMKGTKVQTLGARAVAGAWCMAG